MSHGEYGRSTVDGSTAWGEAAQFAADVCGALDEGDLVTATREIDAGGKAGHARTDH
jgi:hypothetical protein